ncbi:hypothetical protein ACQP2F_33455 [Actinoplanes sp. CA-030573]|uniref:hypothetical protein n=1 Tax=Actinoplanes sp. CA-030573 TaxID=3239898 RepID=UPI003D8A06D6
MFTQHPARHHGDNDPRTDALATYGGVHLPTPEHPAHGDHHRNPHRPKPRQHRLRPPTSTPPTATARHR